jgi:hypothetical protein
MQLPFTQTEFFDVFVRYNTAVWPLKVVFNAAAALVLLGLLASWRGAARSTLVVLAVLWMWVGVVYHGIYFRPINPVAVVFAGFFVVQAILLLWAARSPMEIRVGRDWPTVVGAALIGYGLVVYPVLGQFITGHPFPAAPTFGLPCPTTLFTVGVLLWARPLRARLLVIPVLWSVIGFSAALRLGVYEDAGLAVAAVAGVAGILLALRQKRERRAALPITAA